MGHHQCCPATKAYIFFQYRFCTNIMYGKLNIINNTFRREQWNASSCTIWYRLQYVICPLMPHPWYWSGYHMVHEDLQIEISFRWYQLIGTKKFLNSAGLGENILLACVLNFDISSLLKSVMTCHFSWLLFRSAFRMPTSRSYPRQ